MGKNTGNYAHRITARTIRTAVLAVVIGIANLLPPSYAVFSTPVRQAAAYAGKMETFAQTQMRRYRIPGMAVAVVRDGAVEYAQGFGSAGPGREEVTADTPFLLASVSKSITATAVMQLVEAGKLNLDDPVQKYLPWFEVSGGGASEITVSELLYQTSGFSYTEGIRFNLKPDSPDALEAGVRALASQKLVFQPGTDWEYSNLNYSVLGLLIQQVSGQTYEDYIGEHIFTPLGMNHSYTSLDAARAAGASSGYYPFFGVPVLFDEYIPYTRATLPAGGLWSSAADIGRYLIAQMNDGQSGSPALVSPAGLEKLHAPGFMFDDSQGYAMGWTNQKGFMPEERLANLDSELKNYTDLTVLFHEGDWTNYKSMAFMIPEVHLGVVLLFNTNDPAIPSAFRFMAWDAALIATGGEAQYFPPGDSFVVRYSRWIFGVLALLLAGGLAGLVGLARKVRRGEHAGPRKALTWAGLALLVVVGLVLLIFLWLLPSNYVTLPILRGFAPDLWVLLVLILALLAGWAAAGAVVAGLAVSHARRQRLREGILPAQAG